MEAWQPGSLPRSSEGACREAPWCARVCEVADVPQVEVTRFRNKENNLGEDKAARAYGGHGGSPGQERKHL